MSVRNIFGMSLCMMLLLLAAGPGLAHEEEAPGAQAPWFIETVDSTGDVGQYASVAANAPDAFSTSFKYYDASNQDLRTALRAADPGTGGCGHDLNWWCFESDTAGDVGKYSSKALHADRGGFTAYHDATNRALKALGLHTQGPVTVDAVIEPASTGLYASAALDSEGTPYIAYHFNHPGGADALMVAYAADGDGNCGTGIAAGDWNCYTVQTGEGVGRHASMAVDSEGHFHIAYQDAGNGDLWYATSRTAVNCGPGNSWHCYPVDSTPDVVGQYASIYVDSEDQFHIAYYDDTNDVLKYAAYVGSEGNCAAGQARCDEIDAMMQGYNPSLGVSMAEDPAGYPIIAYQSQYGALNVARPLAALGLHVGSGNCGPEMPFSTWHCETIDPPGKWVAYRNGDYVSIGVGPSGLATIAYYGFITAEGGNLMVAYQRFQAFLPLVMKNQ
jgi:hypothetical protein